MHTACYFETPVESSSFDPYSLLAEFGFSSLLSQNPIAPIAMGTLTDIEASNALHEFTHQDGMLTEMGLWYLHTFWKHIARVSNEPSITGYTPNVSHKIP